MSGATHTPGRVRFVPWHIEEGPAAVRTAEGWILATTASDADAKRIASCWNACEGIDPSAIKDVVEAAKALDAFWLEDWEPPHPVKSEQEPRLLTEQTLDIWRDLRAALAKLNGGAS